MSTNINKMKKDELIEECRKYGLDTDGKKDELLKRLKDFFGENSTANGTRNQSRSNSVSDLSIEDLKQRFDEMQAELEALKIQNAQQNQSQVESNETSIEHITAAAATTTAVEQQQQQPSSLNSGIEDIANENGLRTQSSSRWQVNSASSHLNTMNTSHEFGANHRSSGSFTAISFRDIEHALNSFTGTGNYRIETWIEEFEKYAEMFKWDNLQKLIFAKRMMKDSAKLFLRTVKVSTSN